MNIEMARASDIESLVELRLAYLEADHGTLDAPTAEALVDALPAYFEAHLNRDLFCFLAREGERVAACAFLLIVEKPPSPAFMTGRTGTVLNVYTRPEYRRVGLARRVMARLIEEARAMGVCAMNLKATDAGYALYRSIGFADDINKYHPMKWKP